MYGDHVDHLNVYMNSGNGIGQPVFTKQGTQGQKWIQASITLSPKVPFQVRKGLKILHIHLRVRARERERDSKREIAREREREINKLK